MKAGFVATVLSLGVFFGGGCAWAMGGHGGHGEGSGSTGGSSDCMMAGCGHSRSQESMTHGSEATTDSHNEMGQQKGNPDSAPTDQPNVHTGHSHGASISQRPTDDPKSDQGNE